MPIEPVTLPPRGVAETLEHGDQPEHGPDDAQRRREAAHRHEDRLGLGVALLDEEHFGLENLADDVGVAAVDHQLDALAHELVVEFGGLVLERQQTFAARLLGERHQVRDDLVLVVLRLGERHREAGPEAARRTSSSGTRSSSPRRSRRKPR